MPTFHDALYLAHSSHDTLQRLSHLLTNPEVYPTNLSQHKELASTLSSIQTLAGLILNGAPYSKMAQTARLKQVVLDHTQPSSPPN